MKKPADYSQRKSPSGKERMKELPPEILALADKVIE